MDHAQLPDAGRITHQEIDRLLTAIQAAPLSVTGARDDGTALVNLLDALEKLGLIQDNTTAS